MPELSRGIAQISIRLFKAAILQLMQTGSGRA
jgi:hypothetical protein